MSSSREDVLRRRRKNSNINQALELIADRINILSAKDISAAGRLAALARIKNATMLLCANTSYLKRPSTFPTWPLLSGASDHKMLDEVLKKHRISTLGELVEKSFIQVQGALLEAGSVGDTVVQIFYELYHELEAEHVKKKSLIA